MRRGKHLKIPMFHMAHSIFSIKISISRKLRKNWEKKPCGYRVVINFDFLEWYPIFNIRRPKEYFIWHYRVNTSALLCCNVPLMLALPFCVATSLLQTMTFYRQTMPASFRLISLIFFFLPCLPPGSWSLQKRVR